MASQDDMFSQFSLAADELAAIPYYPREESARMAVLDALMRFVAGPSELRWLVRTAIDVMDKWEGVAQLRALYCTRFRPADGIEGVACTLPGFRPEDMESAFFRRQIEESERRALPSPEDTKITPEEREQIAALQRRIEERTKGRSGTGKAGVAPA
jgi:hypothetical protein